MKILEVNIKYIYTERNLIIFIYKIYVLTMLQTYKPICCD